MCRTCMCVHMCIHLCIHRCYAHTHTRHRSTMRFKEKNPWRFPAGGMALCRLGRVQIRHLGSMVHPGGRLASARHEFLLAQTGFSPKDFRGDMYASKQGWGRTARQRKLESFWSLVFSLLANCRSSKNFKGNLIHTLLPPVHVIHQNAFL